MSNWLYQLSTELWSPERYRLEIWEGERWNWSVGSKKQKEPFPKPGDTVFFFYTPSLGTDPGFYGWAVVLEWYPASSGPLYFRPCVPSDHLKMDPWWDEEAKRIADGIRGPVKQGTLWPIENKEALAVREGIARWLSRSRKKPDNCPLLHLARSAGPHWTRTAEFILTLNAVKGNVLATALYHNPPLPRRRRGVLFPVVNWQRFTPSDFEYDFELDDLAAHGITFYEVVECFFSDFTVRRQVLS